MAVLAPRGPNRALRSYHKYLKGRPTVAANEAKKHHYLPQFYMRRFACADDKNKIMVLERHRDAVVAGRKSIEGIGYEERLHDYDDNGAPTLIEDDLNNEEMAHPTRFERVASTFGGWRSIQLSYGCISHSPSPTDLCRSTDSAINKLEPRWIAGRLRPAIR